MSIADLVDARIGLERGQHMHDMMARLMPLPRSLTGGGVRATLRAVGEKLPLAIHEVASGTAVYDWTVPPEWTFRDAYIASPDGERVVDAAMSSLHVVGYSVPFSGELTLDELRPHLHTLPDRPDWVPYRTAYYTPTWGFCLTQRTLDGLRRDIRYRIVVDTDLFPGSLTYGECLLPGDSDEEVLLSTHVCHPAMANDNLSGIALLTELGEILSDIEHHYTYRLVFLPGTIGSLTWLSQHEDLLPRIRHGLVVTGVGGPGPLVYKRSRHGARAVDRAAAHVVQQRGGEVRPFSPWGYDERQYNSPGFDLPVGRLTRTPHGEYAEYHTSADDLDLVTAGAMADSLQAYLEVIDILEGDGFHLNLRPHGEPQLGRRGLYPSIGGRDAEDQVLAMLWVLNQSDGHASLLDVAVRSSLPFARIRRAASDLAGAGLLERIQGVVQERFV